MITSFFLDVARLFAVLHYVKSRNKKDEIYGFFEKWRASAAGSWGSWQWHNTYAWVFEGSNVTLRNSHEYAQARWREGQISREEYDAILSQRSQIGIIANVQGGWGGSFDGVYNMGIPNTTRHIIFSSSAPGQENLDLDP